MRIRTHNTPHHQQFTLLLSSHLSESCLREFRGRVLSRGAGNDALLQFVPLQESEGESGEVLGLSALFSACTSTDAYSVVSVRDFLIQN